MIIVSNSSPIIFLGKVQQLKLLNILFNTPILVAEEVVKELHVDQRPEMAELTNSTLISVVKTPGGLPGVEFLGEGEKKSIILASMKKASLLLMDDKSGRAIAEALNIPVMGTAGVLLLALKRKCITHPQWHSLLNELIHRHKYRISIEVYNKLMVEASFIQK